MRFSLGILGILLAVSTLSAAEGSRSGLPDPPKADVAYLIHATNLVECETNQATQEESKKETLYWVPGATSGVKTPLAGPQFLMKYEEINPAALELHKMEVNKGRREILYRKKKKTLARPYLLSVFPLEEGLVKMEVDASLEVGEYCLTPQGSNQVFCFTVY